jgi:hypothetical protein
VNKSNFQLKPVIYHIGNGMNDSELNELREASWRRKLTPAEELRVQAFLSANAAAQAEWEDDLALTRQLQELPNAPVSSNFTSLILQAVEAETGQEPRSISLETRWRGWLSGFLPRLALAALVVTLGIGLFFQHQEHSRQQMVEGVKEFLKVASLPVSVSDPGLLEDFDAIQQLQSVSFSKDDDLLAALR